MNKNQGVQNKLVDLNPRAFYTSCGCHSVNLVICDITSTSTKARDFFGIVQRMYTIFCKSIKRWLILQENVKIVTLKPPRVEKVELKASKLQGFKLLNMKPYMN